MADTIGSAHDRIDGRLKVTGGARYAADFAVPNPLYAHLVVSTIARGRITGIDDEEARAVPGVAAVYTHENDLGLSAAEFFGTGGQGQAQQSWRPLDAPDVRFHGEIVGMVVAESLLAAREAAGLLSFTYEEEDPAPVLDSPGVLVEELPDKAVSVGDVERGLREAATTVSGSYATAPNTHNAMELFATTAHWRGSDLTVWVPSQWVRGFQHGLAHELGVDPARIRVLSPFIGGGFGGKGTLFTFTGLVAAAARELGRPVKLYVTRSQGFTVASFRAETRQEIRLGATADGTLTTIEHTGRELTSRPDTYYVNGTDSTSRMYRVDNVRTGVAAVHADRQTPGFMRAPPETPYFFALESALDELARELGMDPVALRVKNDVDHDPIKGVPYTSRSLVECLRRAGERFGWSDYTPAIGSMTDGDWLVGWGVATAAYPTQVSPCAVRVGVDASGRVRVQTASHDPGTGAYTALALVASRKLGVPLESVRVELGDSRLPTGTIAGGSITTASNAAAIGVACDRLLERLGRRPGERTLEAAFAESDGPTALEEYVEWIPEEASPGSRVTLRGGTLRIVGATTEKRVAYAFGAEFVEVRVHRWTREIRVPRIVGAFAAGHIVNAKTARSQYLGGMVWGLGHALLEESEVDPRTGAYVNDNLSEYLVPVHADVPSMEAILVPEEDRANPPGIKGIGELAIVGTAAAVANAVHHATGTRVRKTPIRLEDVLPRG